MAAISSLPSGSESIWFTRRKQEALRVISSAPDKWKPGLNAKGEPIALSLLIPVIFNLPNK